MLEPDSREMGRSPKNAPSHFVSNRSKFRSLEVLITCRTSTGGQVEFAVPQTIKIQDLRFKLDHLLPCHRRKRIYVSDDLAFETANDVALQDALKAPKRNKKQKLLIWAYPTLDSPMTPQLDQVQF